MQHLVDLNQHWILNNYFKVGVFCYQSIALLLKVIKIPDSPLLRVTEAIIFQFLAPFITNQSITILSPLHLFIKLTSEAPADHENEEISQSRHD